MVSFVCLVNEYKNIFIRNVNVIKIEIFLCKMSFDETSLSYVSFIEPVIDQQNGPYRKQRNIFITFTIILLVLLLLSVAILIFIATKQIQPSTPTTLFNNTSTTTDSTTIQQSITTRMYLYFPDFIQNYQEYIFV